MTVGHTLWSDQLTPAEHALLRPGVAASMDREPSVLVVGGGILGCAIAAACVRAELGSVVLLERDRLGAGASGGAAGVLAPEFHVGTDPEVMVSFMRRSLADWRELESTWPAGVGLLPLDYDGHTQARVNPVRSLARLAAALPAVLTGTEVRAVSIMGSAIREVATSIGPFRPRNIVFATGRPPSIDGLALEVPSDEVKGHMVVSQPTDLPAGTSVAELARVIEDGRLLVGGTLDIGDHERVVRAEIADALWRDLVAVWPPAKEMHVDYRWACFRPVHPDRVPVIDRVPGVSNAWFTSGHYKTGILLAPATGRALAQWIATADRPPEIEAFSVSRFMPKS